ncbi:hypothetical protein B7463_g7308, partial [Scytalidium lignicola]
MTFAASGIYTAPEIFLNGDETTKVDIWSLFVTMIWTLDAGGFRRRRLQFKSVTDVQELVSLEAVCGDLSPICEMAIFDPEKRVTAAQMLVKCYNEQELSIFRSQDLALVRDLGETSASNSALPHPFLRAETLDR